MNKDEIFAETGVADYFPQDPDSEQLDEIELIKKLEDASTLEEIKKSPTWRIFREAWRRIYLKADDQLTHIDPGNQSRIAEAQVTKRFYKDILATTIKKVREDGKAAFEHAKDSNLLYKLFPHLKKDF
jgi:hypothetical protein